MILNSHNKLGILLLALSIICYSCFSNSKDCDKVDLSSEETEWFKNYNSGDTIYYRNQYNEVDTFIVNADYILSYTSCNKFELSSFIYQIGSLSFDNIDHYPLKTRRKRYAIGFSKLGQDNGDYPCKKDVSFFELSTGEITDLSRIPTEEFILPAPNGKKIVLYNFIKNKYCSNTEGGQELIEEFSISKEFGLIRYKTLNGDIYNRVW